MKNRYGCIHVFFFTWLFLFSAFQAQAADGDFEVKNRTLVKYHGSAADVNIPAELKADRIGRRAFANSTLRSVTVPMGVAFIDEQAFAGCSFLTSVSLPTTLVSIGDKAFFNCVMLDEIKIPRGLAGIGARAFLNCRSLKTLDFPESLKELGSRALSGCVGLRSLLISKRTKIADHAFMGISCEITYKD